MSQKTSKFLESKFGWDLGESGWNVGMDENILKLSAILTNNVDGVVSVLPASPVVGSVYFLTTDARFYLFESGSWISSPIPKYFTFYEKNTGLKYKFDGIEVAIVEDFDSLSSSITTLNNSVSSLGSAAYEDAASFVTPQELNIAVESGVSESEAYTDSLRSESVNVVQSISDLRGTPPLTANVVVVKGYIGVGDGGGGVYYLDSSDISSLDNGGSVIVSSDNRRWKLKNTGVVRAEQFGVLPIPGRNNADNLAEAVSFCSSNKLRLVLGTGVYEYAGTLDLSYPGLSFHGAGLLNSVLKCTSAGVAVAALGTRPNNNTFSFALDLTDMTFEGNVDTTKIFQIRINHPHLRNINVREASPTVGVGFSIEGVVLGKFDHIVCSTNLQPMTNAPLRGLVLDVDPSDPEGVRRASANTFINPLIEGVAENGMHLVACDQNTFVGGTSENNAGIGIYIISGCRLNTFIGTGLENAGFSDVFDDGAMNRFINCYGTKGVVAGSNSQFHHTQGGYWTSITAADTAFSPTFEDVQVNFLAAKPGLLDIAACPTVSTRNIYNVQAVTYLYPKKVQQSITVGASPFVYTNTANRAEQVYVSSGTILLRRDGTDLYQVAPQSMITLLPGDGVKVTYTTVPFMAKIPQGVGYL